MLASWVKEFDKTMEYISATVDALKDLDRQSSGFQIVDGIAAQTEDHHLVWCFVWCPLIIP